MEQDLKELLQANFEVSKENNRILKKMRGAQRNAMILRVIYWMAVIGIFAGALYYIQPYINKFLSLLPGLDKALNNLPDFSGFLPK